MAVRDDWPTPPPSVAANDGGTSTTGTGAPAAAPVGATPPDDDQRQAGDQQDASIAAVMAGVAIAATEATDSSDVHDKGSVGADGGKAPAGLKPTFETKNAAIGNQTNIGNFYQGGESARQPHVFAVPSELLGRLQALFVRPVDLPAAREAVLLASTKRIFVVHGPRQSGKETTCLHLALSLRAAGLISKISFYRHPLQGAVPFVHYAETDTEALPENTVFIPEASLETEVGGYERWDLVLASALAKRKSYLILRSEQPLGTHLDGGAVGIDAHVADLRAVFASHLGYYAKRSPAGNSWTGAPLADVEARWVEVADLLRFPAQIDRFCSWLVQHPGGVDKKSSRREAEEALRPRQTRRDEARAWMAAFSAPDQLNEKLFALLLSLFQGLPRGVIERIYVDSVTHLRQELVGTLRDPRETGLNSLLRASHASEREAVRPEAESTSRADGAAPATVDAPATVVAAATVDAELETESIFFDETVFGEEALREVNGHLPLLRSLAKPFLDLLEQYAAAGHWRVGKALAEALGRISAWRLDDLSAITDRLMGSPHRNVRMMAGTVLGLAFGDDPSVLRARERGLGKWIESGEPDRMFIIGIALWRVFETVSSTAASHDSTPDEKGKEAVFRLLRKLIDLADSFSESKRIEAAIGAKEEAPDLLSAQQLYRGVVNRWREENLDSAAYALWMMARADPAAVVRRLRDWSDEEAKQPNLREVLGRASAEIFAQEALGEGLPSLDRLQPLLDLVGVVLRDPRDHRRTIEPMMRALARWCEQPERRERVGHALLGLANGIDAQATQALRIALAEHWLAEPHPEVQKLGKVLIARSVAVEGFPCELPGTSRCLLIADTSEEAIDRWAPLVTARLEQLLGGIVDVTVHPLGMQDPAVETGAESSLPADPVSTRPRLMMPLLERHDQEQVSCVLVLTWGPVIDLDDALQSAWAHRLLVVNVDAKQRQKKKEKEKETRPGVMDLRGRITRADLGEIELHLNLLRARQLAAMPTELWRPRLAKELGIDPHDDQALAEQLRHRVPGLERLGSSASPAETRLILSAVLWLAIDDLPACCRLIESWLAGESPAGCPPLLKVLGEASTRMLFRMFACAEPLPDPASHARLLVLAERVVDLSWWSVAVALFALRRWLEDERWRVALLGPGPDAPLRAWLRRVAARHDADLLAFLEEWRAPLDRKVFPSAGEPPAAVAELGDEMAREVAVARSAALPPLPAGRAYAIVIVGAEGGSLPLRWRLGELVTQLVARGGERLGDPLWLVYRCGRSRPQVVIDERPKSRTEGLADRLFPDDEAQRPQLLAPLLAVHSPAQVRFALLLQTQAILDDKDLGAGPWLSLLHSYVVTADAGEGVSTPASREQIAAIEAEADRIVVHLARAHRPPRGADRGAGAGSAARE